MQREEQLREHECTKDFHAEELECCVLPSCGGHKIPQRTMMLFVVSEIKQLGVLLLPAIDKKVSRNPNRVRDTQHDTSSIERQEDGRGLASMKMEATYQDVMYRHRKETID